MSGDPPTRTPDKPGSAPAEGAGVPPEGDRPEADRERQEIERKVYADRIAADRAAEEALERRRGAGRKPRPRPG